MNLPKFNQSNSICGVRLTFLMQNTVKHGSTVCFFERIIIYISTVHVLNLFTLA